MSRTVSRPGTFHCPSRSGPALRHQPQRLQRLRGAEEAQRDVYDGQTSLDDEGNQIGDKGARGHRNGVVEKGHLTRRQDALCGDDESMTKLSNADTLHVTNRSPQVGFYNMG